MIVKMFEVTVIPLDSTKEWLDKRNKSVYKSLIWISNEC